MKETIAGNVLENKKNAPGDKWQSMFQKPLNQCDATPKRRNIMQSGTKDNAEGKMHQAKGKVKEIIGKAIGHPDLEGDGKNENVKGKIQEKVGEIKKVVDK